VNKGAKPEGAVIIERLIESGAYGESIVNHGKPLLASLLYLLLTPVCFGAAENSKQRIFPFRVSEGGLLLIQVTANAGVKGEFIFDTGAGIHVLSNDFLRKLTSRPAGHYTGFRNTGERVDFDLFRIGSLGIGRFRQENPVVAAWEVLDRFQIDGVLSAKFFERHVFTLDFKRRELIFEDRASLRRRIQQGRVIPLKISQDRDKVLGLFVDLSVGTALACEGELDTGFDGLLVLDSKFMKPLGLDGASPGVKRIESRGITGITEVRCQSIVPRVMLLGAPEAEVVKPEVTFKERLIYHGVVGTSFWANRRVTFDIPSRRLIVSRK
jgi:hypothetical protein